MISSNKCPGSCNVLCPKIHAPKKKDINVKPFNMMTNKDEPKAMAEHISCDCKCRGVSTGGKLREPRHPPPPFRNNFSDFCFAKCNNTCSALRFCCHLHLPKEQIMVDL